MDILQELYGEYFTQVSEKVFYIVLVKSIRGQLIVMNTCHPRCPKYEFDWLALNYFNNISDIIIQTSKNTSIDQNLHVYPDKQILDKYNIEIIQKPRFCIITANSLESINFQSAIFQDPLQIVLYTKSNFNHTLPVLQYESFEFDGIRKGCQGLDAGEGKIICLECGATLFNVLMREKQIPDFLFVTVLEGDDDREYLAGELDMIEIVKNFSVVHESKAIRNSEGEWKMRVYQRKET